MSQTRQLAAIMFTDIVGYTALMGDDENKGDEKYNSLRINKNLLQPLNQLLKTGIIIYT